MRKDSESYITPTFEIVLIYVRGTILAGSPDNPGGSIDPFIFDEDVQ